jgi:hypothetical protein
MTVDVRASLIRSMLPARRWPLMAFTFLGPVSVGLGAHAFIQLDRRLLVAAILVGLVGLLLGSLPATLGRTRDDRDGHGVTIQIGGNRRAFGTFLVLEALAGAMWMVPGLRFAIGLLGLAVGVWYLVTLGRSIATAYGGRVSAHVVTWCYALGPTGAVALASLAMRPAHLGDRRELIYIGLGRVAAVAALVFWIVVEREIRRIGRASDEPGPDRYLAYRILIFLLATTGLLVPGGGTPYAISWAAAWLVAAVFERHLRIA